MPANDPTYSREYYLRNKERIKQRKAAWYQANKARIVPKQKEYNRTVRAPRNLARRNAKALQKPLSALPENHDSGPRNNSSQSGENSLPVEQYGSPLPAVPRTDTSPGDGLEIDSVPPAPKSRKTKGTGS